MSHGKAINVIRKMSSNVQLYSTYRSILDDIGCGIHELDQVQSQEKVDDVVCCNAKTGTMHP
jgi:hypothetical protein